MSNVQVRHPFNCKWLVRASISRACLNILDTRHDISFTAVVANSYPFDATATEFGRPLGILIFFFLKQIVHEFWRRLVNYVAKKLVAPQAKFLKLQCQYAKNLWIPVKLSKTWIATMNDFLKIECKVWRIFHEFYWYGWLFVNKKWKVF